MADSMKKRLIEMRCLIEQMPRSESRDIRREYNLLLSEYKEYKKKYSSSENKNDPENSSPKEEEAKETEPEPEKPEQPKEEKQPEPEQSKEEKQPPKIKNSDEEEFSFWW